MDVLEWIVDRSSDLFREIFAWLGGVLSDMGDFFFGWL